MAYLFNGATHTINRADAVLQSWPITMHGRIRLTSVNDGLVHCIMGMWEAGADNGFRLQVESVTSVMKARCGSKASGSASNANTSTSIGDTNWHSVVGEITAANARQVWLDNGGNGTNATSLTPGTLTKTSIGAHDNGGTLSGNIAHELADIAVWAGTLTNEERAALASGVSPALIRPDILKLYLPLIGGGTDQRGANFTVTGATVAIHPAVYMPARSAVAVKTTAAGGISGTSSVSEADDTAVATGTVLVSGAASITEAGDIAIGAAGVSISGVLATTQADDTLTSTGTLVIAAALAESEADDSLAASGTLPIVGTLSAVEADDTIVATGVGSSLNTGVLNATEADDAVSAAATLVLSGTATLTEVGDVSSGAAGLSIVGVASIGEGDDTSTAAGTLTITGLMSANDNDDTLVAMISVSSEAVPRRTGLRPTSRASRLRTNLSTGSRPAAVSRG